jgi:hypothetical protein
MRFICRNGNNPSDVPTRLRFSDARRFAAHSEQEVTFEIPISLCDLNTMTVMRGVTSPLSGIDPYLPS